MKKLVGTYLLCRFQSEMYLKPKRAIFAAGDKPTAAPAAAPDAKEAQKPRDETVINRSKADFQKISKEIADMIAQGTSPEKIMQLTSTEIARITGEILGANANLTQAEQAELKNTLNVAAQALNANLSVLIAQKTAEAKKENESWTDGIEQWVSEAWEDVKNHPGAAAVGAAAGTVGFVFGSYGGAALAYKSAFDATAEKPEAPKPKEGPSAEDTLKTNKQLAQNMKDSPDPALQKQGAELLKTVDEQEAQEKKMKDAEAFAKGAMEGMEFDEEGDGKTAYEAMVAAYMVDGEPGGQKMKKQIVDAGEKNYDNDFRAEKDLPVALASYGVDVNKYNDLNKAHPNMPERDMITAALALKNAKEKLSPKEFEEYEKYVNASLTAAANKVNKTPYGADNAFSKELVPGDKFKDDIDKNVEKRKDVITAVLDHFATPEAMKDPNVLKRARAALVTAGLDGDKINDDKLKAELDKRVAVHKDATTEVHGKVESVLGKYKAGSPELKKLLEDAKKNSDPGAKEQIRKEIAAAIGVDFSTLIPGVYEKNGIVITIGPPPHQYVDVDPSKWNEQPVAAPSGVPGGGSGSKGSKKGGSNENVPQESVMVVLTGANNPSATDKLTVAANAPKVKLRSAADVEGMLNRTRGLTPGEKRDLAKGFKVGDYDAKWDGKKFVVNGSSKPKSDAKNGAIS